MRRLRTGFTTRASCLLAAGLTAVLCGLVLGEVDLVRAGVLAAVIPVAASIAVQRTQVRIANRRSVEPNRTVAGDSVTVHLTITNSGALPSGTLMLEDQLPDRLTGNARFLLDSLGAKQARTVSYRIPALERGHYRVGPLQVRLTDPFGMVDLTRSFTSVSEFIVTPTVDRLPAEALPHADDLGDTGGSRSVGSHGADDASTREYRIGDDLRKIHWKSTARTGTMMVRQEERPWRGVTTVLLDLRGGAHGESADPPALPDGSTDPDPRNRSSLEWAVSATASIGTQVIRSGQRFGLVADTAAREVVPFEDPDRLNGFLATVREQRYTDLAAMTSLARDSSLIAVLGRLDDATLGRMATAPRRGGSRTLCAMLLDVDSWTHPGPGGVPPAAPSATPPSAAPPVGAPGTPVPADAAAILLRSAGWRVAIVRRGDPVARAWALMNAGSAPAGRR